MTLSLNKAIVANWAQSFIHSKAFSYAVFFLNLVYYILIFYDAPDVTFAYIDLALEHLSWRVQRHSASILLYTLVPLRLSGEAELNDRYHAARRTNV